MNGTIVKEPGKTGSQWRIHYSISLPKFQCDHFELTSRKGTGTSETLQRIPVSPNDCLIADRGYCYSRDIQYVDEKGGYVIVRVNLVTLPFFKDRKAKKRFDLLAAIQKLQDTGDVGEWQIYVKAPEAEQSVQGRICVIRKREQAIERSLKKLRRVASKEQRVLQEQTLEYAKYVIVFTTLPKGSFSAKDILEWYRVRWQIELVFKRFKSLAKLGHLPKYDDDSSRA